MRACRRRARSRPICTQLLNDALALYNGLFADVRFERRFAAALPQVRVDPEQMRRVVINLVDNAIEAIDRNGTIVDRNGARSRQQPRARSTVADDGPGIPAEEREKLFLPYYSTKGRGSGLGLAIVRRIVAEHGGSIEWPTTVPRDALHHRAAVREATSTYDTKTRRTRSARRDVRLQACLGVLRVLRVGSLAMPSILVVDDEPGVRSSLSGVLRDEGFDVEPARSGEECLERAARAAYDVIVLDVWLPGIDGLVTLQRLRERKIDAQVVMISGHGNIESAVRAIKMGAFDFVEKPLSLEKTVLVVRNALRQRDLETENRALRARVDRQHVMIGESFAMRQLREQVDDGRADQRPGADLRRERHRQGAGGAHDSSVEPPARLARSSKSTAPRFPKS